MYFRFRRREKGEDIDAYLKAKEEAEAIWQAEQEGQKCPEHKAFERWAELGRQLVHLQKIEAELGESSLNLAELVTYKEDDEYRQALHEKMAVLSEEMKALEKEACKWWKFLGAGNCEGNMWSFLRR